MYNYMIVEADTLSEKKAIGIPSDNNKICYNGSMGIELYKSVSEYVFCGACKCSEKSWS